MMFIYDGLKDCTMEMLGNIVVPMILLIVIGVAGMAALVFVISKVLHTGFGEACNRTIQHSLRIYERDHHRVNL